MPIDPAEQRKREEARADVETEKAIQAHEKYIKTLKDEIDVLAKLATKTQDEQDRLDHLTERVKKSTEAHKKHQDIIREKLDDMDRENSGLNKLASGYDKASQKLLAFAKTANTLLTAQHNYYIETQKIIDLSGKFTKSTQAGTDAFNKMRTELNLTRQAGIEFGKVFSQINRMGIDTAKFTEGTKQLQKAFGQKGGVAMMGVAAGTKASTPILEAAMGGDQVAIAKAMRSANLDQAHALSRLTGGGGGLAGRAGRFEETAARAAKVKDDIQAGMAAALDLGMGPEMGALALPLAEINANVAKLVNLSIGMNGGLAKFLQGGGIGGFGKAGGGGGGAMSALTGAPGAAGGMSALSKLGWGGLIAAGGMAAGTALHHYGEMEPEDSTKGLYMRRGGRMLQGAGIGGGIGMMMGGPAGAAAGATIGAGAGAIASLFEENKKWIDETTSWAVDGMNNWVQGLLLSEETIKNIDYENSLLELTTYAKGAAESLEGLAGTVANLPETLENQIAQSRLPHALASLDPKPMEDLLTSASKSFDTTIGESSGVWESGMAGFGKRLKDFEDKAAAAGEGTTEQTKMLEGAKNVRAEMAKYQLGMDKQMEAASMMGSAKQAMQGFETQRGFRATEVQAATSEYERKFAGTGNVEEMQKLQDQVNAANEANLTNLQTSADQSRKQLTAEMVRYQNLSKQAGIEEHLRQSYENRAGMAEDELRQLERTTKATEQQLRAENQQKVIQTALEQAMAATETIMFKRSQRAMALAKAQESFVRERGAAPAEVGAYAGEQAKESQAQLSSFMDTFNDRMANLKAKMEGASDVQRLALVQKMYDLDAKRVELAHENLKAQMHAATAEEKHRQELIGSNRRISEIQRDTASKMGMSWRVQMQYQGEVIAASRQDLESKSREIERMGSAIKASGGDPKQNAEYMRASADYAQKAGDLIGQVMGKQRSFMEQSIANSFGIGGGTKVNPLINSRLFGEQVQGFGGQRQAVGAGGGPRTMEEQQMQNIRNLGPPVFGGIGGAPPGAMQGVPPGAPGAAPGAPGVAQAGGKPGVDVSGNVQVAVSLDTPMLKAEVKSAVEVAMKEAARPGNMA